jgi:hypothetical protein
MVLTVSSVLSPVIGLSCHRHLAEVTSADLIPASRNQDHTASPSALRRARPAHRMRPPHSAPHVRDDRETPLLRARNGIRSIAVSTESKSVIFFAAGLDKMANQFVARVSEAIRGTRQKEVPDVACAHPGYAAGQAGKSVSLPHGSRRCCAPPHHEGFGLRRCFDLMLRSARASRSMRGESPKAPIDLSTPSTSSP